ncbi:VWA domain-containing protein [Branchiibius cervicis]|uniref:VWA domain-containing protein n=1 Tax=Branchiibius cervicis TaxID=908252 RepID=A0ABW2AUX9_9MICO
MAEVADRLVLFTHALREHGVPVGTSEGIDAALAAQTLGFADRDRLRAGLASALTGSPAERAIFDPLFDLYFPLAVGVRAVEDRDLLAELSTALAQNDSLDQLAVDAVTQHGRVGSGWSAQQTLQQLRPERAIAGAVKGDGGFSQAYERDELRARVGRFRELVEAEARRRNAEIRGVEQISRYAVDKTLLERDLLGLGPGDLAALKAELVPLAKKLAARLRARETARGPIDVRRTMRSSMSTGGVPMDPVYRKRSKHRPDLVVLADLSGSVGGFSMFTLLLLKALHSHFRRLRVLGFVSSAADITDLITGDLLSGSLTYWALERPELTRRGRSSNYEQSLRDLAAADGLTSRTTLLILGDARSNHARPDLDTLETIRRTVRRVYWLNPEARSRWDTGDSVASAYGQIVPMHEVRTAAGLRHFVERVL